MHCASGKVLTDREKCINDTYMYIPWLAPYKIYRGLAKRVVGLIY